MGGTAIPVDNIAGDCKVVGHAPAELLAQLGIHRE